MKYYMLDKENLQLNKIQKQDFYKWINHEDEDYIYLLFNPTDHKISSLSDLSPYWFHVMSDELDQAVHTKELDAVDYFEFLSDSSHASDLLRYETSYNNNTKHDLLTILKEIQDTMDSMQQHKYDYSRRD